MSIEFRYDGVLLGAFRVRLPPNQGGVAGLPGAAFNGEVGTAGLTIEDPEGDLDLVGLHEFTVDETDCAKPRIFTGWLYGRTITRGKYRDGPGRVWVCDVVDQNFAWGLKVFRASSAKRPAESDNTRMRFMIESAPMAANPVFDNGLFNTTDNPVNFGDSDYVGQYPVELAVSVAGTSGKNFYAYWDDTADEISGYYDQVGAVIRESTLRISNVITDQNSVTFYPTVDAEMRRNPERVASGILLFYRGAAVYVQRAQTITDFIDRDWVHRTDRIGRAETANAVANDMLIAQSVEQDTIQVTIRVPSSQVNLAREGEWMDVKFTHLPGLESFTQLPIIRRNVAPVSGRRDRYDLTLELSTKAPERGPGGGDPIDFPPVVCSEETGDLVQISDWKIGIAQGTAPGSFATLPAVPQVDNLLVAYQTFSISSHTATPTGFTIIGSAVDTDGSQQKSQLSYRVVEDGDGATIGWSGTGNTGSMTLQVSEHRGPLALASSDIEETTADQGGNPVTIPFGSVTPVLGSRFLVIGGGHGGDSADSAYGYDPSLTGGGTLLGEQPVTSPSTTAPAAAWGYDTGLSTGAAVSMGWSSPHTSGIFHGTGGILAAFECTGSDQPPASGQDVHREAVGEGDGTTTTFTTTWPYADGTLRVWVDGVEIILGLTETDPETGEFTLDFAPLGAIGDSPAEVIYVSYLGR